MNNNNVLFPLFHGKKEWDYAFIHCVGRSPIAVEPDTKIYMDEKEELLTIEDNEAPNPLYRGTGPEEPKYITLTARVDVSSISSVDFIRFNKIQPVKGKIITAK